MAAKAALKPVMSSCRGRHTHTSMHECADTRRLARANDNACVCLQHMLKAHEAVNRSDLFSWCSGTYATYMRSLVETREMEGDKERERERERKRE
jgi:hypothetical protein